MNKGYKEMQTFHLKKWREIRWKFFI